MARVTDRGINGLVGTVIFYTVNGENYVRARGRTGKKSRRAADNPLNTVFGTVSTFGSGMIKRMSTSFLFPFTRDTYNRLRGWMRNRYEAHKNDTTWELSAQHSSMCQVNPEIDLRDLLFADITVSDNGNGKISVSIPGMVPKQSIQAPLRTGKVNMKLIAITSPFRETGLRNTFCMEQFTFNYSDNIVPAKTIILDTKAAAGDIAIVVIALEYEMTAGMYNMEKRWLPAAVVAMGRVGM